ncbi:MULTISPECIES: pyruvate oxidase [Streptomyces]|uniref:Pyruvate oxidase n=1 Tax=Streptomyces canarius TaxID=285453 RepID=A0ABQ3DBJ1_9ACTN|nr:pyruvate oxidase [Streptomyces canarius]GHA73571.1 pyruvate oxidase [Streptomyces canarius]
MARISAAHVMMRVLEDWGVGTVFGLPGGSLDSTMAAVHDFRERIHYVGVRHEEVGALAAVAQSKLTGRIGVTIGSAGPGAVHLLNGLYDARADNVPVLALVGQVPTSLMNTDYFQEMPENPVFDDVAVYNRTVTSPELLPQVVDTAIRTAYAKRGVAVVVIPKDLGWAEIEDDYVSSAGAWTQPEWRLEARSEDVARALELITTAERPILYFGRGAHGAADLLRELSERLGAPLVSTYLGKTILDDAEPSYMISTGRVSAKPAVDVGLTADLIVFIGTNYEFGAHLFSPDARFIDVNLEPTVIGARHAVELGIRADAVVFLEQLLDAVRAAEPPSHAGGPSAAAGARGRWLAAAREDKRQWDAWVAERARDEDLPLRLEAVYAEINQVTEPDAVFGVDVGNVNISTARFLHLGPGHQMVTSPFYATMGFGLPAGIAAALSYPGRQVWTLSGDGGMAMVIPDLVTQAEQRLPVINVVFTNRSLGFIEAEQDDTPQPHSGIALSDVDFAKVAEGFGVRGHTVVTREELREVLSKVAHTEEPVLIDVKVTDDRQLPAEQFPLRASDRADFADFRRRYRAEALEPFADIAARHGVALG